MAKEKEPKPKKLKVPVGSPYWVYIYDEKQNCIPKQRIEENSRYDNLYREVDNYFFSEEECIDEINRINNLKK